MTVPYTFANQSGPLSLSQLDADFACIGPTSSYQIATAGQTVFTGLNYVPGNNSLKVYVDGLKQIINLAYSETNASTVTFVSGLHVGAVVEFTG